uniref:Odorant receptor n=1 Tax=Tribolium castaneum TaxID=7070 RepID=C0Z3Q9_TRICA|nr:olfactory receptor 12 [Tribolium castaneum]
MAHNLDVDLTEFVRFNIKCIQFFGYFSPDFRNNSQRKLLFRIYAALFVGFAFILSLLSQIANMVDAFGDIEKMTEASFLLFTNLVQCFKIYTFANHGKKVWNLVYSMNRSDFKPNNLAQYWIVVNEIKTSKIISKLFLLACTLTCVSWAISPLLDKRGSDELRLPLSGWYPFSTEKSPAFEFAYTYQIFTTWVGGLGDISMDTFMSGTIMVISTQLSLLKDGLENVARNIKHDKSSVNKNLIQCACHYRSIIQFAAEVTNLFTTCITAQFVVGVIIVCMSMFQMSLVSVLSFQFAAMLLYQICVLMEIYLWCFYGNEVMLKSDQLTQAAYMSEWLDGTEEFKQNLLFLMTRTQFPLKLYASGGKVTQSYLLNLE